ncbi:MAG TPA: helix-turn-helix transcriptional regulator [bacterium]|nr:helix-turn-helix transcriptional regulator [bacterium]HPV65144.1 helix-turn-helix transcriptional regulator [bacterium]
MSVNNLKKELFKNKKFKKYYNNSSDLSLEISENIINARLKNGLTQKDLAELLKTKQSSISRLEKGLSLPSLSFLLKIAEALGMKLSAPKLFTYPVSVSCKSNV